MSQLIRYSNSTDYAKDKHCGNYGLVVNGQNVAYCSIGKYQQVKPYVTIPPDDEELPLLGDLNTTTSFRNRGYGTLLIANMVQLCRENGFKRVYTAVYDHNEASQKIMLKNGFIVVDRIIVKSRKARIYVYELS